MLISRKLYNWLKIWKNSNSRKPLILEGARQVGKSTLIAEFSTEYRHFLSFNLEKPQDAQLFDLAKPLAEIINLLFIARNKVYKPEETYLIFLDEIQEAPHVIEMLRYFYEDYPNLHVIATGSLLDFALAYIERTPVGRVSYATLNPICFEEYLQGAKLEAMHAALTAMPFDNNYYDIVEQAFYEYAQIGGMPELLAHFILHKDRVALRPLYNDLIKSYKTDATKYAQSPMQIQVLNHILDIAPYEIDKRITLTHFGRSEFRAREVKQAFAALQKARLLELVYPATNIEPPLLPNYNRSPRLHYLDIGLVNHQLGLHAELLQYKNLEATSKGSLVQQLVLQEMRSLDLNNGHTPYFWVRDEKNASAEVDIVIRYKQHIIPIEIKSGATGTLRSLHQFMDACPHHFAVRFYSGPLKIEDTQTRTGKKFKLLNLPLFLASQIELYLQWWIK